MEGATFQPSTTTLVSSYIEAVRDEALGRLDDPDTDTLQAIEPKIVRVAGLEPGRDPDRNLRCSLGQDSILDGSSLPRKQLTRTKSRRPGLLPLVAGFYFSSIV